MHGKIEQQRQEKGERGDRGMSEDPERSPPSVGNNNRGDGWQENRIKGRRSHVQCPFSPPPTHTIVFSHTTLEHIHPPVQYCGIFQSSFQSIQIQPQSHSALEVPLRTSCYRNRLLRTHNNRPIWVSNGQPLKIVANVIIIAEG